MTDKTKLAALLSCIMLLILLIAASRIFPESYFLGELKPNEFVQHILVLLVVTGHVILLNQTKEKSEYISLIVRTIIFSILLYEEISFITANKFNWWDGVNFQGEANMHNLYLIHMPFREINFLKQYTYWQNLSIFYLLQIGAAFILGLGHLARKNSILWHFGLCKCISFFAFTFLINHYGSNILESISTLKGQILHQELLETFMYFVFASDTLIKLIQNREKRRKRLTK